MYELGPFRGLNFWYFAHLARFCDKVQGPNLFVM